GGQLRPAVRHVDEVSLLERPKQLVRVPEAGVEAAHRRARAPRDLGDRDRRMALLLDEDLGRVEEALEGALAARLLGAGDGLEREGDGLGHDQNQNPILVLTSGPARRPPPPAGGGFHEAPTAQPPFRRTQGPPPPQTNAFPPRNPRPGGES